MINTDKLVGIMAERHKTGKDVAERLGISPKTFYAKMKKGIFGTDEMEEMICFLDIEDPMPVFFMPKK